MLFFRLSDMALNIEDLLANIPERERDAERKQVKCQDPRGVVHCLLAPLGFLISSSAASPHNRWSSCCGRTTRSWGLSTGSTAGSALEIPHRTSLWWPAFSFGASSKTAASIIRAFLCPRLTAWWQVSSTKVPPILLREPESSCLNVCFPCVCVTDSANLAEVHSPFSPILLRRFLFCLVVLAYNVYHEDLR